MKGSFNNRQVTNTKGKESSLEVKSPFRVKSTSPPINFISTLANDLFWADEFWQRQKLILMDECFSNGKRVTVTRRLHKRQLRRIILQHGFVYKNRYTHRYEDRLDIFHPQPDGTNNFLLNNKFSLHFADLTWVVHSIVTTRATLTNQTRFIPEGTVDNCENLTPFHGLSQTPNSQTQNQFNCLQQTKKKPVLV